MTIFLTTQYLEEADQLADRVAIIDNGVLRAQGTPIELKKTIGNDIVSIKLSEDNYEIRSKLLDLPSVTSVEQDNKIFTISMADASKHISELVTTLSALGQRPEELSIRTPTLDDVFLEVTGSHLKENETIQARPAGFFRDVTTVAGRALRAIPREPEAILPALIIPIFFFIVNTGALSKVSSFAGINDYKAFQLPVSIVFAVTGISRASALVTDIKSGYFDRLLMTPISRVSLLLGLMVADFTLVIALSIPVVILGFVVGVSFTTGILGILGFLLISGLWGLAFTGFPYAIALKTGNPAAVNSAFLLFFPFSFLTTSFLPKEALSGWLATASDYNPVTYLLAGLRAIISTGWVWQDISRALIAIAIILAISFTLAFSALKGRVSRK